MDEKPFTSEELQKVILDDAKARYVELNKRLKNLPADKPLTHHPSPPGMKAHRPMGTINVERYEINQDMIKLKKETAEKVKPFREDLSEDEVQKVVDKEFQEAIEIDEEIEQNPVSASQERMEKLQQERKNAQPKKEEFSVEQYYSQTARVDRNSRGEDFEKNKTDITKDEK